MFCTEAIWSSEVCVLGLWSLEKIIKILVILHIRAFVILLLKNYSLKKQKSILYLLCLPFQEKQLISCDISLMATYFTDTWERFIFCFSSNCYWSWNNLIMESSNILDTQFPLLGFRCEFFCRFLLSLRLYLISLCLCELVQLTLKGFIIRLCCFWSNHKLRQFHNLLLCSFRIRVFEVFNHIFFPGNLPSTFVSSP